jgi:hypothetical protein
MASLHAGALLARRYRLIDPIGAGGMSIIWRARDELLDRMVAIKVLTSELAANAKFRDLVREEARAAAQLVHPHVTSVHDYGEVVGADGTITSFVVMELLTGEELEARLTAGPLRWQKAVEICAQVAEALAAAHRLGIVHRDVTPANIMLTPVGAKVLDFGIATHVGAPDEDESGDTFGTPAYVAPERLDGLPAQPATDTYSLGVLLFETLTGQVPFPADTWDDLARAQPGGPMPPLVVPGLPREVVDICRRCLSRDPRQRPTAHQVGEALRDQLLPADPQAATMLSPTMTLPAVPADAPLALAGTGGRAALVGAPVDGPPSYGVDGPPAYGVGVAVAPHHAAPSQAAPGQRARPGAGGPPVSPGADDPGDGPGHGSGPGGLGPDRLDPGDDGYGPRRHRAYDPPTEPDRDPRTVWSPVRMVLVAVGAVAALGAALLVGLNLGAATRDTPTTGREAAPPASVPEAGTRAAPTAGGSAPGAPVASAGPSAAASATPLTAGPTVRQAVAQLRAVIDAGLAAGQIRRDAGIDLQQMVNGLGTEPADVDRRVATLKQKVVTRAGERAISREYADRLADALDRVANARPA